MGDKYAFGFMDEIREGEPRHFGHGGGAPGINGDLRICPQRGYVIAVLSNLDPPAANPNLRFHMKSAGPRIAASRAAAERRGRSSF